MAVDTPTIDTRARLRQVPVQELVLPVVIIALIIIGVIIRPGIFLTSDNLLNVLTQASITGIIAIGMTFVIATGGIDLSVGSVLAAASIAGGLLTSYGSWIFSEFRPSCCQADWPVHRRWSATWWNWTR